MKVNAENVSYAHCEVCESIARFSRDESRLGIPVGPMGPMGIPWEWE